MKNGILKYIILINLVILFTSCFNEDLNKISDEYIWEPDISIPIFEDLYYITDTRLSGAISSIYSDINIEYIPITKDFNLNFNDLFDDVDYIQSLDLNLGIDNHIPSEIQVFMDFMKYPNIYIKTLELEQDITVPAATINSNGEIIQSQSFVKLFPIDISDNSLIQETEFIRLEIRLVNREISDEVIANLDNYFCNCSIGLKAVLKVPVN